MRKTIGLKQRVKLGRVTAANALLELAKDPMARTSHTYAWLQRKVKAASAQSETAVEDTPRKSYQRIRPPVSTGERKASHRVSSKGLVLVVKPSRNLLTKIKKSDKVGA